MKHNAEMVRHYAPCPKRDSCFPRPIEKARLFLFRVENEKNRCFPLLSASANPVHPQTTEARYAILCRQLKCRTKANLVASRTGWPTSGRAVRVELPAVRIGTRFITLHSHAHTRTHTCASQAATIKRPKRINIKKRTDEPRETVPQNERHNVPGPENEPYVTETCGTEMMTLMTHHTKM